MNAVTVIADPRTFGADDRGIFAGRLRGASDHELLAHFRDRDQVRFFPVADPEETRREKIDRILDNCFEFNDERFSFADGVPWLDNPSRDLEWHISLHKFYYGVGLGMVFHQTRDSTYLQTWVELVDSWIRVTPPGFIAADVTGRRVQNWIYAYYYFVSNNRWDPVPADFHRRFLVSLHQQVEYLRDNLHPARNHRTLELYAVFLAGLVFPEFERAALWRDSALADLVDNALTDLLPDGVQCELSTDYHHLVLKNYLNVRRLAAINNIPVPAVMDERLRRALDFTLHAHKPDGDIPSLSDGDSRSFLDLMLQGYELFGDETWLYAGTRGQHGKPPRETSRGFDDAGYYFVRSGWGECEAYDQERYLVFDCGPLGAGNHGHLDALNVELAAYGRSLVVDPGRYTYDESGPVNWRVRFRGTAYHNTVQVDGLNQTAYLARPGKRHKISGAAPDTHLQRRIDRPGFNYLHGTARSHCYEAVHHRHVLALHGEYWLIVDRLEASGAHRYDLRYHLAETAEGQLQVARQGRLCVVDSPGLLVAAELEADDEFDVEPGYVSYRYGVKMAAPVLRYSRSATTTWFATLLHPWREQRPQAHLRRLDTEPFGETRNSALAVQVDRTIGGETLTDVCMVSTRDDGAEWRFGTYRTDAGFAFISRDAGGRVMSLQTNAGAQILENGQPLRHPEARP